MQTLNFWNKLSQIQQLQNMVDLTQQCHESKGTPSDKQQK